MAEGLWLIIIVGCILVSLYIGLFYLAAALIFRWFYRRSFLITLIGFPAAWVLIEYSRSLGEVSFPWMHLGYATISMLPIAQLSSITGVYGISFLIVLTNVAIFQAIRQYCRPYSDRQVVLSCLRIPGALLIFWILVAIAGWVRLASDNQVTKSAEVACVQHNIDQSHWGNESFDTSLVFTQQLVYSAGKERPDLIILPESALLCYLMRRPSIVNLVQSWGDSLKIPLVLGALHWEPSPQSRWYRYLVYNAAFYFDPATREFDTYCKMKLLPFSEALPFEARFPIISRVNLGEADFHAGTDPVVFSIGKQIRGVPLICYEIIYPGFVRLRCVDTTNLIINITNDGWFGHSSASYHHASMARMRCIENGISMARCANSGISMLVDGYGRVLASAGLYKRTIVQGKIPIDRIRTLYSRFGDWPVGMSLLLFIGCLGILVIRRIL